MPEQSKIEIIITDPDGSQTLFEAPLVQDINYEEKWEDPQTSGGLDFQLRSTSQMERITFSFRPLLSGDPARYYTVQRTHGRS